MLNLHYLLTSSSHILPTLYNVSPSLQALAITAGYVNPNSTPNQSLLRTLPLVTTSCVEVNVVEEFESFRRDVGGQTGCIAVIDPNGTCIWSLTESDGISISTTEDLLGLEQTLVAFLDQSNGEDVLMS